MSPQSILRRRFWVAREADSDNAANGFGSFRPGHPDRAIMTDGILPQFQIDQHRIMIAPLRLLGIVSDGRQVVRMEQVIDPENLSSPRYVKMIPRPFSQKARLSGRPATAGKYRTSACRWKSPQTIARGVPSWIIPGDPDRPARRTLKLRPNWLENVFQPLVSSESADRPVPDRYSRSSLVDLGALHMVVIDA